MSKPDEVIYVNDVSVSGFLNGIINISLAQFRWKAETREGEAQVIPGVAVAVDLRMDLYCAMQVRDALDRILQEQTKPAPKAN